MIEKRFLALLAITIPCIALNYNVENKGIQLVPVIAQSNSSEIPLLVNPTSANPLQGFQHPLQGEGSYNGLSHSDTQLYADDIAAPLGKAIYAMRSGTVKEVQQNIDDLPIGKSGSEANQFDVNYIQIEHDTDVKHQSGKPYRSFYLHIKKNSATVNVGDRVTTGQKIAEVGHNGWSSGPHLHVEVNYSTGLGVFKRQTVPYIWNKPFDYNK